MSDSAVRCFVKHRNRLRC